MQKFLMVQKLIDSAKTLDGVPMAQIFKQRKNSKRRPDATKASGPK